MTRIAIFASGSGSNAENIFNYFKESDNVEVSLILTNNPSAFVIERAKNMNVTSHVFTKSDFLNTDEILHILAKNNVNLIVLAGFLLKIPENLIKKFSNKIVNIHPALLPKYGGKGMYGDNVHKAVVANKETESGITIHFVNEHYDEGKIIFQAKCTVLENDTYENVAAKVHKLEYEHFPKAINQLIKKQI
ncbi:MAG: phosphoribosylglycinamide formyltransferase [Vicingaceae bacterium]|nr:phosphoribosylglycinamide formyltransferase [Vicingaceae bacterium]